MGFSRQEYWSGFLCPPPGDLPDSGIEPLSLTSPALLSGFCTTCTTWEAPEWPQGLSFPFGEMCGSSPQCGSPPGTCFTVVVVCSHTTGSCYSSMGWTGQDIVTNQQKVGRLDHLGWRQQEDLSWLLNCVCGRDEGNGRCIWGGAYGSFALIYM